MATSVGEIIVNAKLNSAQFTSALKSLNSSATSAAKTLQAAGQSSAKAFDGSAASVKQLASAADSAAASVKRIDGSNIKQLGQSASISAGSIRTISSSASVAGGALRSINGTGIAAAGNAASAASGSIKGITSSASMAGRAVAGIGTSAATAARGINSIDTGGFTEKFKALPNAIGSAFTSVKNVASNAMGQISTDATSMLGGLAGGLKGGVAGLAGLLKTGLEAAAKAAMTGIATAAGATVSAIGGVITGAVKQFADYEQYVGGVQKIFQAGADTVISNADKAYKTAGLSANQYLSNVTDFSASLVKDMNNDFEGAATEADKAITDMADNANTFGTSMSVLTYAYQGFAKDNYTMLDNLKLGYGGTQGEMAKLINDSGVLGDSVKVTAETVKDVPFNKIIDAIHVTQENLRITGTTSKEAASTVSGSINTMKASWDNLLTAMGTGQDVEGATQKFIESLQQVIQNLSPVIQRVIENLDPIVSQIAAALAPLWDKYIKPLIDQLAPIVTQYITEILQAAGGAILSGMFNLWYSGMSSLYDGIISGVGSIIGAIPGLVGEFFGNLAWLVGDYFAGMFNDLIKPVGEGAYNIGATIFNAIVDFVSGIPAKVGEILGGIKDWAGNVYNAAAELGGNIWDGIVDWVKSIPGAVGDWIDSIKDWWQNVYNSAAELGSAIWDGIVDWVKSIPGEIWNTITGAVDKVKDYVKNAFSNIGSNISDAAGSVWDSVTGAFGFATGGYISGAGTSTSDSIPARLSDGEFVVRAAAVRSVGVPALNHINQRGTLPGYATGGLVSRNATPGEAVNALAGVIGRVINDIGITIENIPQSLLNGLQALIKRITSAIGDGLADINDIFGGGVGNASSLAGGLDDIGGIIGGLIGGGGGSRVTNNYYQFDRAANDNYLYSRTVGGL